MTNVFSLEQGELQDEYEAGGKVEQEQEAVSEHCDPSPGEAALPDALGPCHHVQPDVAVQNETGTDECSHEEIDVYPCCVVELEEAQGDEGQTLVHLLGGVVRILLTHEHES